MADDDSALIAHERPLEETGIGATLEFAVKRALRGIPGVGFSLDLAAHVYGNNDNRAREAWTDQVWDEVNELKKQLDALAEEVDEVRQDAILRENVMRDFVRCIISAPGPAKRRALIALSAKRLDPRCSESTISFWWHRVMDMDESWLAVLFKAHENGGTFGHETKREIFGHSGGRAAEAVLHAMSKSGILFRDGDSIDYQLKPDGIELAQLLA